MEFAPVIIWIVFLFFTLFLNANKSKAPAANEKAIKARAQEIAEDKHIDKTPAFIKEAKARQVFAKPTEEKTHDHKGEVHDSVLLEDRGNDWLARQIREEARIAKRNLQ